MGSVSEAIEALLVAASVVTLTAHAMFASLLLQLIVMRVALPLINFPIGGAVGIAEVARRAHAFGFRAWTTRAQFLAVAIVSGGCLLR